MSFDKLKKIFKRHPFLYLTRFRLLSKNSTIEDIKFYTYNHLNSKEKIPAYFYEINSLIFKNGRPKDDLDTVLTLSIWLKTHIKGGPGLSEPSSKALHTMLAGKGGVCSDMSQVFNNFCVINDIKIREWGTTSTPFNRSYGGHSFNEFYSKELQKWLLIDVYWGFMFYDENGIPLSVIEFYLLKRANGVFEYRSFLSDRLESSTVERNYLNPSTTPFLICDYRNDVYDKYLEYNRSMSPIFIIHFFIYLMQRSYHYRFPLDDYKKIFS